MSSSVFTPLTTQKLKYKRAFGTPTYHRYRRLEKGTYKEKNRRVTRSFDRGLSIDVREHRNPFCPAVSCRLAFAGSLPTTTKNKKKMASTGGECQSSCCIWRAIIVLYRFHTILSNPRLRVRGEGVPKTPSSTSLKNDLSDRGVRHVTSRLTDGRICCDNGGGRGWVG